MRGNILVLTITRAMGMLARGMVFPYMSLFILALGGEPKQVGLINSISPLAGLLMFPLAGYLCDRTGRVKLIAIGGYFSSAILLLYILAPSWQAIALARLLQGFMVFQFPPTSALIADSLSPENRGRGMAAMNTISGAAAIIAPYFAGTLIDAQGVSRGVRILYGVMMVAYLLGAIINHRFLQDTSEATESASGPINLLDTFKQAYGNIPATLRQLPRSVKALSVVITLGFISNGIAGSFWVVYADDHIGLSASQWGLILLIETLLRSVMYIPAGVAADRWGRTRCIMASMFLSLIAIPAFVLVRGFWPVLLIRAAMGTATAFFVTACSALMADCVPREMRGRAMAAIGRGAVFLGAASGGMGGPGMGFVITVPLMLASLAGGYLYEANPVSPWFLTSGAVAVAIALTALFIRDPQTAEA
jgi:MFS family permease